MRQYLLISGVLAAGALPVAGQSTNADSLMQRSWTRGWQLGLRAGIAVTNASIHSGDAFPGSSYQAPRQGSFAPALLAQHSIGGRTFARATLSLLELPTHIAANVASPSSYTYGTSLGYGMAKSPVLRLELGRLLPLGAAGRTRLLGAAGAGVLMALTPSYYNQQGNSAPQAALIRLYSPTSELRRLHQLGPVLGLRTGIEREMRWRDVIGFEASWQVGLLPLYRTTAQFEYTDELGTTSLFQASSQTHGSFVEAGISYRWQPHKRALGLPTLPRVKKPWQPLPERGLYAAASLRTIAHFYRQRRVGFEGQGRTNAVMLPLAPAARLGYQWSSGWLAEAGVQSVFVPLATSYTLNAPTPFTRLRTRQSGSTTLLAASDKYTEAYAAWLVQGGRRWMLRPNRLYAAVKGGAQLMRFTGSAYSRETEIRQDFNAPAANPILLQFEYFAPARWRVLASAEAEAEVRISRRTLLGMQVGYAARLVPSSRADRLVISWEQDGVAAVPIESVSRMAYWSGGLQLRRVLHL